MKKKLLRFLSILLGNALLAFAVCAFVVPNGFMLGGANGIALALQNVLPLPLSVLTAVLNGSLFLVGWALMGKEFAGTTLLSTIIYPIIMAVFERLPLDTLFEADTLTCALYAAALCGLGVGLVIRAGGATGGMDIPPCILQKYKGISVGSSMRIFDGAIVLAQVAFHGLDGILQSLIIILLMSYVVDKTVVSGEQKVEIIIISPEYEQIRRAILEKMDCGATMLDIETGYEGERQKAVLSVVYAKKYPAIRDTALRIDPKAFIVANEVRNVNGVGYTISRSPKE